MTVKIKLSLILHQVQQYQLKWDKNLRGPIESCIRWEVHCIHNWEKFSERNKMVNRSLWGHIPAKFCIVGGVPSSPQHRYTIITLDCNVCAVPVAWARDLHAPFMTTTDGNQYSFMQGAIIVLSVKPSSPPSLFAVEAHDECVRVNWPR